MPSLKFTKQRCQWRLATAVLSVCMLLLCTPSHSPSVNGPSTLSVVRMAFAAPTAPSGGGEVLFTFGYLRMAVSGIDSPNCLAGFFATVKHYNDHNLIPGVRFKLNVTTIPCHSVAECRSLSPENIAIRDHFIASMGRYSAIFKPNAILASNIVDGAKRIGGGIPVIDPHDMRTTSFQQGSENVIHFNPNWVRQVDHLFTYMMQTAQCAHTGIFHGRIADVLSGEYHEQIEKMQSLFTNGNYALPPVLEVQSANDTAFFEFFLAHSPLRQCFIVLGTHELLVETMEHLLQFPEFKIDNFRFFGVSFVMADAFEIHPSDPLLMPVAVYPTASTIFKHMVYSHWLPPMSSPDLAVAFSRWYATHEGGTMPPGERLAINTTHEAYAPSVLVTTYKGYMMMRMMLEVVRDAIGVVGFDALNTTAMAFGDDGLGDVIPPPAIRWSVLVDSFYRHGYTIDGHAFNPLVRSCPTLPAVQMCFCNSFTANSYIFGINTTTGFPQYISDDAAKGQRAIAAVHYPTVCGYTASSWSYPITGLGLFPQRLVDTHRAGNATIEAAMNMNIYNSPIYNGTTVFGDDELSESYVLFQRVFGILTREVNFAPTAPTRALRFASFGVDEALALASTPPNSSSYSSEPTPMTDAVAHYVDTVNPFVLYGTMQGDLTNSGPKKILTLCNSLMSIDTEDPPLTEHSSWRWNMLSLQPVLADYIHSLCGYYSASERQFSAVFAIATTHREAELISMSFATWGYLVPTESIPITTDPAEVRRLVALFLSTSTWNNLAQRYDSNPFVLIATTANPNRLVEAAAKTAGEVGRGTLALACSITRSFKAKLATSFAKASSIDVTLNPTRPDDTSAIGDIIFGAFRKEWWLAASYVGVPPELQPYVPKPRYHIAHMLLKFSQELNAQVYFDYKTTAAQVLYRMSSVTAADIAFGPFWNASCTAAEIEGNVKDRRCQCTKGIRTIYVHSFRNFFQERLSYNTKQYAYTMATCGVDYRPYVPPMSQLQAAAAAFPVSAIIGAAVAGAIVLLVVGIVVFLCTSVNTRNNKRAPKDSTKPFTIVFTDIQSSTSLWSRAPSAMSEAIEDHHSHLRRAIYKNNGYEVKTVGDSFMVAFKEVEDAVRFSLDAQLFLFEAEWSPEIDATYIELVLEGGAGNDDDDEDIDEDLSGYGPATNAGGRGYLGSNGTASSGAPPAAVLESVSSTMTGVPMQHMTGTATSPSPPHHHHRHSNAVPQAYSSGDEEGASGAVSGDHRRAPSPSPPPPGGGVVGMGRRKVSIILCDASSYSVDQRTTATTTNNSSHHAGQQFTAVKGVRSGGCITSASEDDGGEHQQHDNEGGRHRSILLSPRPSVGAASRQSYSRGSEAGEHSVTSPSASSRALHQHASLNGSSAFPPPPPMTTTTTATANISAQQPQSQQQRHAVGPLSPQGPLGGLFSPFNASSDTVYSALQNTADGQQHPPSILAVGPPSSLDPHRLQQHQMNHHASSLTQKPNNNSNTDYASTTLDETIKHMSVEEQSLLNESAINPAVWRGLRVRIGVHHGHGDIRKDPVTHGYDYYGTVTNTAARVEGVGHGGQILLTEEVAAALSPTFAVDNKAVLISLGPQPLRGLDEPIKLYQLVPEKLQARRFPALRLHIEKENEDEDDVADGLLETLGDGEGTSLLGAAGETDARTYNSSHRGSSHNTMATVRQHSSRAHHHANANGGGGGEDFMLMQSNGVVGFSAGVSSSQQPNRASRHAPGSPIVVRRAAETPESLALRLCDTRQYALVPPELIVHYYHFVVAAFGPAQDKHKAGVFSKLAESWGIKDAEGSFGKGFAGGAPNEGGGGKGAKQQLKSSSAAAASIQLRLIISIIAKVTKSMIVANKKAGKRNHGQAHATPLSGSSQQQQHHVGVHPQQLPTYGAAAVPHLSVSSGGTALLSNTTHRSGAPPMRAGVVSRTASNTTVPASQRGENSIATMVVSNGGTHHHSHYSGRPRRSSIVVDEPNVCGNGVARLALAGVANAGSRSHSESLAPSSSAALSPIPPPNVTFHQNNNHPPDATEAAIGQPNNNNATTTTINHNNMHTTYSSMGFTSSAAMPSSPMNAAGHREGIIASTRGGAEGRGAAHNHNHHQLSMVPPMGMNSDATLFARAANNSDQHHPNRLLGDSSTTTTIIVGLGGGGGEEVSVGNPLPYLGALGGDRSSPRAASSSQHLSQS